MLWGLSVCDWATWRHHNVGVLPLWLDSARDDIRENGLSVCDWATWRHHNVGVLPLWLDSARDDIRENGLSVCDWATWRHHNVSVLPLCSGDCRCATELHGGTTTLVFYHCALGTVGVRLSYMEAPQRWCSTTVLWNGLSVCDWATWRHHNVGVLPLCSGDCRCATELHGGTTTLVFYHCALGTVGVRLSYMEAPQRWCSTTVLWGLSVCDWATWRHHNVSVLPLCSGDCRCATELHGGTTTLVFYHCGWTVRGMI